MAVEVDYYAVLGVARDANTEAIEAAVKKAMREWRKRTEAADLSVRQEAEVKVEQIETARTTLLEVSTRAAYDSELAGGVKESAAPAAVTPDGQTWLESAEGYLAVADYHSAAYAAREATQVEGTNAKTWWIRSRANAGLQIWSDALYEAKQAVQLEEDNGEYHFNLGLVHEQMGTYDDAINEYRRGSTCDPTNPMYELAVGGVYASIGRPDQALPVIEAVYGKHPDDATTNYYLGSVLIDLAERVPRHKGDDSYAVSSQEEIDKMRELAQRAKGLNVVDDEVRGNADNILRYLDKMEEHAFRPPKEILAGALGLGAEAGCLGGMIGLWLAFMLIFLPAILLLIGFSIIGNSPGGGLFCILAGGFLGWVWFKLSWIPRWKHNKKDLG